MPLLEKVQRQAQQVAEDIGFPLHPDGRADGQQQPGSQNANGLLQHQQNQEAQCQRGQQVDVPRNHDVVHDHLHE